MTDQIYIESWLPDKELADQGKNKHIENIIEFYHYTDEPATVVLIEAVQMNVNSAEIQELLQSINIDAKLIAQITSPKSILKQMNNDVMDKLNQILQNGAKLNL